ncbi:MAG TPA: PEP-CTERM sorting domain-containing protein [Bryobacteraceae bacterium]|jgi:MYXO-CTERM domain-containing protein|nr:PEP-CTERM sorting domain-containing protein [Bryobacteraceae bacterium]
MSRADSTVTLHVQGVYSDSTTFSGSLVYDQPAQAFIGGSITDSAPLSAWGMSFDPQTYTGQNAYTITLPGCVLGCDQFGAEFYTSGNPYGLPYLDLYFAGDPSTFAGGPIQPIQTYVGYFGPESNTSQEVIGEGATRQVISGSLCAVSDAPEPATWLLSLPGLALAGIVRRSRRPVR